MPDTSIRRVLVALFLVIAAFAAIILIGTRGIGKKIGVPGVDTLVSGVLERFNLSPAPETELPWNIRDLVGTWSGISDVDGTAWEFTFEDNYAVRVRSSSGYSFDGTAFVHWRLGLTEGHLRVPPGWNILDVDTINASEQSQRNKVSLGAYSLSKNILKYCFNEPGKSARPAADMSGDGIRCFDLVKGEDVAARHSGIRTPAAGTTRHRPFPSVPTGAVNTAAAPSSLIAGQAEMTIKGSHDTWLLRTDPGSVTDFTDLHRLTLQFQQGGTNLSAARRIELTLDATRTGRHTADGFVYLENLFIREKVPVGSEKSDHPQAVFLYIANDGRIFPPEHLCDILISRAYGGGRDIQLKGEMTGCTVNSAGEQIELGPISLSVTGRLN